MGARICAKRNTVAIDIEIAAEVLARVELLAGHDLAAVEAAVFVPRQRIGQPFLHADVEIG
jgi:hypothetical protein